MDVAQRLKKNAELLDRILYTPILESWEPERQRLSISLALKANLDVDGWLRIFTDLAHKHLGLTKPSVKSCQNFVSRINHKLYDGQTIALHGYLNVRISKDGWLEKV